MGGLSGEGPLTRGMLALGVALTASWALLSSAHGQDFQTWRKFRATKFAELSAARRDPVEQIAEIKAKTTSLIAAYVPPSPPNLDQPPVIWRTSDAPVVVFDAPYSPRMIIVPAGEFTMGSSANEPGHTEREGARHRVRITHPIAVSMFPVVYGEYDWFVSETHHVSGAKCVTDEDGVVAARAGRDWRTPGYVQGITNAVACVDFNDATAYAAWLTKKTGHTYRLLSEAEYEYAERAGSTTAYWWGDDAAAACAYANGFDLDAKPYTGSPPPLACHDGYPVASPAGKFKPNAFGLFDMAGNVASWTADCWNPTYAGAPGDGRPATNGDCGSRALRGGSWLSVNLRSASRGGDPVAYVGAHHGFRVARVS